MRAVNSRLVLCEAASLAREISTSAATLSANPSLPGSTPMSAITASRLSSTSP
jgi:hypothetical protein